MNSTNSELPNYTVTSCLHTTAHTEVMCPESLISTGDHALCDRAKARGCVHDIIEHIASMQHRTGQPTEHVGGRAAVFALTSGYVQVGLVGVGQLQQRVDSAGPNHNFYLDVPGLQRPAKNGFEFETLLVPFEGFIGTPALVRIRGKALVRDSLLIKAGGRHAHLAIVDKLRIHSFLGRFDSAASVAQFTRANFFDIQPAIKAVRAREILDQALAACFVIDQDPAEGDRTKQNFRQEIQITLAELGDFGTPARVQLFLDHPAFVRKPRLYDGEKEQFRVGLIQCKQTLFRIVRNALAPTRSHGRHQHRGASANHTRIASNGRSRPDWSARSSIRSMCAGVLNWGALKCVSVKVPSQISRCWPHLPQSVVRCQSSS